VPDSTAHVLVVGVDGVRYDTLQSCDTPTIDAIAANGFLRPVRVNDAGPTISGPGWATVFTGVLADRHRIFDNNLSPNQLAQFPDFVHHAGQVRPEIARFVGAGWAPLVTAESGGPLFADGGYYPDGGPAHSEDEWTRVDDAVTDAGAQFLRAHDGAHGSAAVVYLGGPDEVCHLVGVCPAYSAFIEASDARIGRLLAAVDARPTRANENWAVIVVTDHGHVDEGGHGGDTPEERTAWIAAAGAGVPADLGDAVLEQADVAAHALAVLGIDAAAPAQMTGRPFGRRAA